MKIRRAQFGRLALLAMLGGTILFTACGGGGGGQSSESPPAPLEITTTDLPDAIENSSYSYRVRSAGGTPYYTWSLTPDSGPLPPGLTLTATNGYITGEPTTAGTYTFTCKITDSASRSATRTLSITVIPKLKMITTHLPSGFLNEPYEYALQAEGGMAPYTWTVESGHTLPAWLSLTTEGVLSGTPTQRGYHVCRVELRDGSSQVVTASFQIFVDGPLEITTTSLPAGDTYQNYSAGLTASGGKSPVSWSLSPDSTLPAGLTFDPSGHISGTPTVFGTFSLTVQAVDSSSPPKTATRTFTLVIANTLRITTNAWLPSGIINRVYSTTIQALAGIPPYTWSVIGGSGSSIFSLNAATGEITGNPVQDGSFTLNIQVTDSGTPTQTATREFQISVQLPPAFVTTSFPDGVAERNYMMENGQISGGLPPCNIRVIGGSLPDGFSVGSGSSCNSFGLNGYTLNPGLFNFTLELTDSSAPPFTATRDFSLRIHDALRITTTSLPDGNIGEPYNATLTATGGNPPYRWYAQLPSHLQYDAETGRLFGLPSIPGNFGVFVSVSDSPRFDYGVGGNLPLNIGNLPKIRTSVLPRAKLGVPYKIGLVVVGGLPPYAWTIVSGNLSAGLALDSSTGQISGTPHSEETQAITVRLEDSDTPPKSDEKALSLSVVANLGRNDSMATATPISNGTFHASLSPYADSVDGPANSDNDYYQLTANPGTVVTVETFAARLSPSSPADTVIEILDASGGRPSICRTNYDSYDHFDQPCMNDDIETGVVQDSKLEFRVDGTPGAPVTFFVRVLDWGGRARPDFLYDLQITGAN